MSTQHSQLTTHNSRLVLFVVAWLLTACGSIPLPTKGTVQVVATIATLADWAREVGGERVTVTQLVPVGVDPRQHVLSEADQAALVRADVVFMNGVGLEPWLEDYFDNHYNKRVIIIDASEYVGTGAEFDSVRRSQSPLNAPNDEPMVPEVAPDAAVQRPIISPYQWLNPATAQRTVFLIAQTIARVDAAGWPIYRQRVARYSAEIDNLDNRIQRTMDRLPRTDFDDLNQWLDPFRERFRLDDPTEVSTQGVPTARRVVVDAFLPPAERAQLLASRQLRPTIELTLLPDPQQVLTLNALNDERYLALMDRLTEQLAQGLLH